MANLREFSTLDLDTGAMTVDRIIPLTGAANRFPPGYAQVPLDAAFFPRDTDPWRGFRVRICPIASREKFGDRSRRTDNVTDEFTVVTPEP